MHKILEMKHFKPFNLIAIFYTIPCTIANLTSTKFPAKFKFRVGTSAYQIEGAWNLNGKGESIWDYQTHTFPNRIVDRSNADVACDAYHKTDEDIANLKKLKVNFYRFSISWTRLLPTGFIYKVNNDGIEYYNDLINKLIKNGIKPFVTLYQWDLPQNLQNLGGWTNNKIVEYFSDYARLCFELFGDRVKVWITINEPYMICENGYGNAVFAPFYNMRTVASYLCGHNLILAHAKVYRMYQREFRNFQKGAVGFTAETPVCIPSTDLSEDIEASDRFLQMHFGWFINPIFKSGDYPTIMRIRVDLLSIYQGFKTSRLPYFTKKEIMEIKESYDFLGLNHYQTYICKEGETPLGRIPTQEIDANVDKTLPKDWESGSNRRFRTAPWGLSKILNWIKIEYRNPAVIITENGYSGFPDEGTNDLARANYINVYLEAVLKAIQQYNCRVIGYTVWSYMDNFEWSDGYTMRFGLYHVDFEDPKRPRKPKKSAFVYQNIIVTKQLNNTILDDFVW